MDLRTQMNKRPTVTIGVSVGAVLIVGILVLVVSGRSRQRPPSSETSGANCYYTADEGKTFEVGPWTLVPPYEKDGKTFVRMYKFLDGKTEKIGYLEKYTDQACAVLMAEEEGQAREMKMSELGFNGRVVKRPGEETWVDRTSEEGKAITEVMTSEGRGRAKPVFPK